MKYLTQFLIIMGFTLLGEALQRLIPLPIPASVYGLTLLFLALCTGALKKEQIDETAKLLIACLGLFFVAPAVNILAYWEIITPALVPICVIIFSSTFVVFIVAGLVTQALRRKGGEENG